jgi:glycosyltransferase involved in cell wall biosynthesis
MVCQLAFGFRRPVVASAVGGLPEAVRDGVDGLLVPPEDPRALADAIRELAVRLPQLSAGITVHPSYEDYADRLLAALESRLGTQPR